MCAQNENEMNVNVHLQMERNFKGSQELYGLLTKIVEIPKTQ